MVNSSGFWSGGHMPPLLLPPRLPLSQGLLAQRPGCGEATATPPHSISYPPSPFKHDPFWSSVVRDGLCDSLAPTPKTDDFITLKEPCTVHLQSFALALLSAAMLAIKKFFSHFPESATALMVPTVQCCRRRHVSNLVPLLRPLLKHCHRLSCVHFASTAPLPMPLPPATSANIYFMACKADEKNCQAAF